MTSSVLHSDGREALRDAQDEIHRIVNLLYQVGLEKLADRLDFVSGDLAKAEATMVKAYDELLTGAVRHAENSAHGMLAIALHMAEKG